MTTVFTENQIMTLEALVLSAAIDGIGETSLPVLQGLPGQDGQDGDTIYYEYAFADETLDWHSVFVTGDIYRKERIITNGALGDWSDAARFIGEAGADGSTVTTEYQYSINGLDVWHSVFTTGDYYRRERIVTDGVEGDWSDAAQFVPIAGQDYFVGTINAEFETVELSEVTFDSATLSIVTFDFESADYDRTFVLEPMLFSGGEVTANYKLNGVDSKNILCSVMSPRVAFSIAADLSGTIALTMTEANANSITVSEQTALVLIKAV